MLPMCYLVINNFAYLESDHNDQPSWKCYLLVEISSEQVMIPNEYSWSLYSQVKGHFGGYQSFVKQFQRL